MALFGNSGLDTIGELSEHLKPGRATGDCSMKVAVSAVAAREGAAGIGRYAANVAHSLMSHGDGIELLVLAVPGSEVERMPMPD